MYQVFLAHFLWVHVERGFHLLSSKRRWTPRLLENLNSCIASISHAFPNYSRGRSTNVLPKKLQLFGESILRSELYKLISKLRFSTSYITSEAQTLFVWLASFVCLFACLVGWFCCWVDWWVGLLVCWLVGRLFVWKSMFFSNKIQVGVCQGMSQKTVLVKVVFLWVICIVHYVNFVALPLHLSRIPNRKFQT